MSINWGAFGIVLAVSLVSTVGVVGLFTGGFVALSKPGTAARSTGYACFALCAAAVAYGIYLIAG